MLDLIRTAYGVDADKVLGGPNWLDGDRFDVVAKAPAGSTPDAMKLMLQTLLADRFKLVVHNDTRPMPAYALTVGKKPQLKQADGTGDSGCKLPTGGIQLNSASGEAPSISYSCHNITMADFADGMRRMLLAPQYLNGATVVDQTGLKGSWNFDFKYSLRGIVLNGAATSAADVTTLFDAVDKQLGLKLEMGKVPMPVIVVDSVNRTPTGNPPGVTQSLPALPTEFEVADIKPADPNSNRRGYQVQPGGRVNIQGMPMKFLIQRAWNITNDEMLVGLPKWAETEGFDIVAKAPTFGPAPVPSSVPSPGQAPAQMVDMDSINLMVRSLLINRFKMAVHNEERPVTAYTLTALKPKLKPADPANRMGFHEGPGADGKDPRTTNPTASRLVTCQNMTMAQFAENLPRIAGGYVGGSDVLDATGIEGAYDFTLNFSVVGVVGGMGGGGRGGGDAAQALGGAPEASDPSGGITLYEALEKQLGLKLEKTKRPGTVLVIDHMEQKPTDEN
jgi:uncharacterized protein (TIGR03435 family)